MPTASWDSVMGGRVPAALPRGVLWLALPRHYLLPSPWREAPQGTVLESHRALGNLLPGWVASPAGGEGPRGEGPRGASQGSLNSPDKGLCSWLVCTVQNTPQG